MSNKKTKVCLVSSCGGHFMELMQLLPFVKDKHYYIVAEKNVSSIASVEKHPHHYLIQQEREGISFMNIRKHPINKYDDCGHSYFFTCISKIYH